MMHFPQLHTAIADARGACRVANELHDGLDRMIAIQMQSYPDHWSDADKREVAQQHLFGKGR